jgi:carbamoyltransferase
MIIWGITALGHDGAISVVKDEDILFAGHSERYSRVKNDPYLNNEIVEEALSYGEPNEIIWYEKPLLKKSRQAWAGQWKEVFGKNTMPKPYLKKFFNKLPTVSSIRHHEAHAAAGVLTSNYNEAVVIVLDAIGEWNCCTIWDWKDNELKLIERNNYPHSFGLFYSAFTQRCGLKPNEEEYILMGMAAYGQPIYKDKIWNDFINDNLTFKKNLHIGVGYDYLPDADIMDIASSVQEIAEQFIFEYASRSMLLTGYNNLVYMGGVALNCVANTRLYELFDNIWIMPNPGDAGNSLGAAISKNKDYGNRVNWKGPFLGTNIEGEYPCASIVQELYKNKICGVANGRAEFGPRALGNRSLLADPRGEDIKDKVNKIKKRQKFRPFAPAILEEHLGEYFKIPTTKSPYMQFIADAKMITKKNYPAIIHADGTSRVQTVSKEDNPGFRKLLENWFAETGCPMLLNTSLNIKGEPLVNTEKHANDFENKYNTKVFTKE